MTPLEPQTGHLPVPFPTVTSQPYWDGCARGELLFQRCSRCANAIHTPALVCGRCWSQELVWERSLGAGEIYSWTTVWRPPTTVFVVPYAPAIVELDEGWQLLSCLIGCDPDAIGIGMRVAVEFHATASGFLLPYFRPVDGLDATATGG